MNILSLVFKDVRKLLKFDLVISHTGPDFTISCIKCTSFYVVQHTQI